MQARSSVGHERFFSHKPQEQSHCLRAAGVLDLDPVQPGLLHVGAEHGREDPGPGGEEQLGGVEELVAADHSHVLGHVTVEVGSQGVGPSQFLLRMLGISRAMRSVDKIDWMEIGIDSTQENPS